jgi:hypothetical protein
MNDILSNFQLLWNKSITEADRKNADKIRNFNKLKLNSDHICDAEMLIMNELCKVNQNIYEFHLWLIGWTGSSSFKFRDMAVLFVNRTFESWLKQRANGVKKGQSKNGNHLTDNCSKNVCLCELNDSHVIRAFQIASQMFMDIFNSFDKIYKFDVKIELLDIDNVMKTLNESNKFKLINRLKLNDRYNINTDEVSSLFTLK